MLLFLLGSLVLLLAIMIFRTVQLSAREPDVEPSTPLPVNLDEATQRLSRAIQFKTVSQQDASMIDGDEFHKMHRFLAKAFPLVHEKLSRETVNHYSLLYRWEGKNPDLKPIMLTCHLDVVPVEPGTEADWDHPPFAGAITDEHIYGRGTMDVQSGVMAILEATEALLQQGYEPERTVYLGFGHDEEIDGEFGASEIGKLLQERGIEMEFLLDEGLPVVEELIEGIKSPVALVAVAEKGYLSLELSLTAEGGHSSVPQGTTSIARLGKALHRLENTPLPAKFDAHLTATFEAIGTGMPFYLRFVMANLWLFKGLLRRFLATIPATNAAIRTTTATTIFESGVKENLIPTLARAVVNFRIHPNDSVESVIAHVKKAIGDDAIKVEKLFGHIEPSPVSSITNTPYRQLSRAIREIFPEVAVAPSLMVGATDARHYTGISRNIYRFFPLRAEQSDLDRVHGTNERLSIQNYGEMIQFYARVIRNTTG
ncbi:carboxypeptidase PM20D1 [Cyclonatronum proteinivorum]|uniref:Carboxypeptidase PM20D1 n=1 Tax=Cyclonatronum proteinivorum TaxID=1457365 RepID=A0A345UPA0_9BACT|nr:M20 family peptidase [Cyclonatronum proteinivorum]AXJ02302.1 carboxypeptidase PM20D1 [Cyclonatronum proteinivorum]